MKLSTLLIFAFALAALTYLGLKWFHARGPDQANEVALSDADRGAQIYAMNCQDCHGAARVSSGSAPDLRLFSKSEDQFRETLFAGFYPMPNFEGILSEDDVNALWVYVSSPSSDASSP